MLQMSRWMGNGAEHVEVRWVIREEAQSKERPEDRRPQTTWGGVRMHEEGWPRPGMNDQVGLQPQVSTQEHSCSCFEMAAS